MLPYSVLGSLGSHACPRTFTAYLLEGPPDCDPALRGPFLSLSTLPSLLGRCRVPEAGRGPPAQALRAWAWGAQQDGHHTYVT